MSGKVRRMSHTVKIAKLLEERGWSVSQLAERVGAPQSTVDKMVKRMPKSLRVYLKMAEVLGASPFWLYDDTLGWPADGPPPMNPQEWSAEDVAEMLNGIVQQLRRRRQPRDR
jgi:transcriptional regulator with XRE-family HTH domain